MIHLWTKLEKIGDDEIYRKRYQYLIMEVNMKKLFKPFMCVLISFLFLVTMDMPAMACDSKKDLPNKIDSGTFNIITEPFEWWQDVTKVMLNLGKKVSNSDLSLDTFKVSAINYDGETHKTAYDGPRPITKAYVSDVNGNPRNKDRYIVLELTHGVTQTADPKDTNRTSVDGAATGRYGSFYFRFDMHYSVVMQKAIGKVQPIQLAQGKIINLLVDRFKLNTFTDSKDQKMNYALYSPKKDGRKHPLMIWFHGMGEGGTTNPGVQLYANRAVAFADDEFQGFMGGAYVLAPQCPTFWPGGFNFSARSPYTDTVMELIHTVLAQNSNIDLSRIYIGGLSMGGYMAWNMLNEAPDLFAGSILSSAAYCPTADVAARLKNMPMWIVYNTADTTCPPDAWTRKSYNTMLAAGSTVVRSTEYQPTAEGPAVFDGIRYAGHDGGWIPVYRNMPSYVKDGKTISIFQWLAAQSKANVETAKLAKPSITCKGTSLTVSWNGVKDASGYEVYSKIDGKWQLYKTVTSNSFEDINVTAGNTYFYKVRAFRDIGVNEKLYSKFSHEASITIKR